MDRVRVLNRTTTERIRLMIGMLLPESRVVHGHFAVNVPDGGAGAIVGGYRGDPLTDRPEGCEALAATLIVVPHVGVQLPAGMSFEYFMRESSKFFGDDPEVVEAIQRARR